MKTLYIYMLTSTEVNPKSWTQHLLFICKEEHELRTEREQKGAYNVL